jgi:hypothetical protein
LHQHQIEKKKEKYIFYNKKIFEDPSTSAKTQVIKMKRTQEGEEEHSFSKKLRNCTEDAVR